jgi:hypothetical protein
MGRRIGRAPNLLIRKNAGALENAPEITQYMTNGLLAIKPES